MLQNEPVMFLGDGSERRFHRALSVPLPEEERMQSEQRPPLVLQVVPPRNASTRDIAALETVMQGLALSSRHPVALEIASTAQGCQFLLRATTPAALEHLAAQIQARYPQAVIRPLAEDPLMIRAGETVKAIELYPGAASYLPLRAFRERELPAEGTDPLLGLLAAITHLPANMRVVSQLALLPLPPTWSQAQRRRAVEHPLEPERQRQRRTMMSSGSVAPSTASIMAMGILVALLVLWYRFSRKLPAWVLHVGTLLLHGKNPQLTPPQLTLLITSLVGIGLVALLVLFGANRLLHRFGQTSIYDMRLVAEKTGRSAYRARLRLFVIVTREAGAGIKVATKEAPFVEAIRRPLLYESCPQRVKKPFARMFSFSRYLRDASRWQHRQSLGQRVVGERLTAAYRQYHTAAGGYFDARSLSAGKARRLLKRKGGLASFISGWECNLRRSRHVLSVADIAVLWHLPQTDDLPDLPLLERGRARSFLAPLEVTSGNGWRIGQSTHAGYTLSVSLPVEALRHNLLAVARTGKGKSTLFLHLARAVICSETKTDGLFVMEPHRELIEALSGLIPPARLDDVVLVDVADMAYPPGINPLDATLGRDRDKAVDNLITIFERIWINSWGPRTENVLEFSLKTLLDANERIVRDDLQHGPDRQYTLLDVVPLLRTTSFRHTVMEQVTDGALLSWWQQYFEPMDLRFQMEVTSSVLNKMSKFSSSRTTRRILGQPRSTINFTEIVRAGKILLVSTASGVVGADVAALLGATLLGLFHVTLAEQAELQREQRRRFLALIDEFQVFQGADYSTMLAELRKYGGSFGLATQSLAYLDRLDRTLRSTVLANVDHLFAFTMSGEDARLLHELDGIEEADITNLDDFTCYARVSLVGRRLPIFSLRLDAPAEGNKEQVQLLRVRCRQRYARPVEVVDALVAQGAARHTVPNFSSSNAIKRTEQGQVSSDPTREPTEHKANKPVPGGAGRQKHRGMGGKASERAGERSLSMPLVYENEEQVAGQEEEHDDGH